MDASEDRGGLSPIDIPAAPVVPFAVATVATASHGRHLDAFLVFSFVFFFCLPVPETYKEY